MGRGLSTLSYIWFTLATAIVSIDLTYVLTRPSFEGVKTPEHPLARTFPFDQWVYYSTFDKRYAPNDDTFVIVQSWCNLFECLLQLTAVVASLSGLYKFAHKTALVVCVMVAYKTVMYGMMEHFDNSKYTKHNPTGTLVQMVIIPSSFWIIFPVYVGWQSWQRLTIEPPAVRSIPPVKKGQ